MRVSKQEKQSSLEDLKNHEEAWSVITSRRRAPFVVRYTSNVDAHFMMC